MDCTCEEILRPWVTLRDGRRIYAAHHGKKAFRIKIRCAACRGQR